eukprot:gene6997-11163_t
MNFNFQILNEEETTTWDNFNEKDSDQFKWTESHKRRRVVLTKITELLGFFIIRLKKKYNALLECRNCIYGRAPNFQMEKNIMDQEFKKIKKLLSDINIPENELNKAEKKIKNKKYHDETELLKQKVRIQYEVIEHYKNISGNIQSLVESRDKDRFMEELNAMAAGIYVTYIFCYVKTSFKKVDFQTLFMHKCYLLKTVLSKSNIDLPPKWLKKCNQHETLNEEELHFEIKFLADAFGCRDLKEYFVYPLDIFMELDSITIPRFRDE